MGDIYKGELQDYQGNTIHPHTEAEIVFTLDGRKVEEVIAALEKILGDATGKTDSLEANNSKLLATAAATNALKKLVATAQSTADTAKKNAATAQTTADTALTRTAALQENFQDGVNTIVSAVNTKAGTSLTGANTPAEIANVISNIKTGSTPTLVHKEGSSWNSTATLQMVVPAGHYFIVQATHTRLIFDTSSYTMTGTPSHELGTVHYASVDTTVFYQVYTSATRASCSMSVAYWEE